MQSKDAYKEVRTFKFPGLIAKVHFPDLTEEERNKRMTAIQKQAANLLKKVEKND